MFVIATEQSSQAEYLYVGEPEKKKQEVSLADDDTSVVEDGKIFFLYRPRVGFTEAKSLSDVQRFYLVRKLALTQHSPPFCHGKT